MSSRFILKNVGMQLGYLLFFASITWLLPIKSPAQKIHKFEQLNVTDGLSQNFVQSIYCDDKGFLWFGTWDGLNRYDGRQFKIFKVNPKQRNTLTNNRIIDIWQDKQNKLWVKTNDGYIHYFMDETYEFITFPYYLKSLEERNSTITCFDEGENGVVMLGSSNSGFYFLTFNEETNRYTDRQFLNRGERTVSNDTISFIITDALNEIWIGTKSGLNNISREELSKDDPSFSNYWTDHEFTTAFNRDSILFFGTAEHGIKTYESNLRRFDQYPEQFDKLREKSITVIEETYDDILTVGTKDHGLYFYDLQAQKLTLQILSDKTIRKVFKDSFNELWINTNEFGIYKFDLATKNLKYYELTNEKIRSIVDDERQYIYEDTDKNLWIALHGAGLAHYNRAEEKFDFYQNQPKDNTTISSDNVYCLTQDQSGLIWAGTGAPSGGVNKVFTSNKAFKMIRLEENIISGNENIVRSLLIDSNENIWLGTKSGKIYILNKEYEVLEIFHRLPLVNNGESPGQNAYAMMQDNEGYIWIGTKGGGIYVTEFPVDHPNYEYGNQRFFHYQYSPDDDKSVSSDIIYSIMQDSDQRIWIGSYEGGLNLLIERSEDHLECLRFKTDNSDISSDKVRYLFEDRDKTLWITSAFGINYIDLNTFDEQAPKLNSTQFHPRNESSLSYNDVIHVFQDSNDQLWFGTSGGGVNKLAGKYEDSLIFKHITSVQGLVNDVVYAITEDEKGTLWFSTDHGISGYNPKDETFDNFDRSNNLTTDAFNENTVKITGDKKLLFGTNDGLLIIDPDKIEENDFKPNVVFTNFQLFNKDVDITDPESPINQDIGTLDQIVLKHSQSSFSIEYAALSYFAPTKNKYAFMLENFDLQWNEVGNQNKATYTNLAPGEYVFKVKAANWNSDWSDKIKSIAVTILPPWWKTTTMYIIYTVILIVVIEVIRRAYVRYHKLQNDLTVEKRVNDIKLQFFTNISHEIRTPLTLILGPVHDITEMKNIPAAISNKLLLVEKNGKRMLRLVNQLLDFRKVQKNKMTIKVHKIELVSFIRSIIENFDLTAQHKKIKIIFEPEREKFDVWADPNKFDSVIFNVLSNALKFSPKHTAVRIAVKSGSGNFIDITVQDHGAGIPKERIHLIFQRFSPLSDDTDEFSSSGIGLAYSYQIMKIHHGDIMVKSELHKGSVFTIRLIKGNAHFTEEEILDEEAESYYTLKNDKNRVDNTDERVAVSKKSTEKEYHILIVEDNMQILNYLKENLEENFNISVAYNGAEALTAVKNNQPDIIITDIMMPVTDGIKFTQQLKDSLETSHIPVIMLTAKSSVQDQIEGVESGAEAYILKPFNMTYVKAVVKNLIKQRSIIHMKFIRGADHGYSGLKITNKDERFLNDISRLILDNYSDPEFNIEKLVENSYVSRTVFYNKIKSLTGLTPIDFLRQKRLHIASQMILETDYNISEIAVFTGFNDTKNFSRRFKEIYNLTPTQYKQEMMSQN